MKKKRSKIESNFDDIKVFEAFAGYGGASFGLKRAKINFNIIGYSEIDKFAIEFYENNHPNIKNYGDITKINPSDIPNFDLFTGGFPCQPFSQVGLGKGEDDIRGTLFYDIIKICGVKKPKHILLENVKGLKTARHGRTLKTIQNKLAELGYDVITQVINSKDHGIPQNRERLWIYAYHGSLPIFFQLEPPRTKLKVFFNDLLDKKPDENLFKNQQQIKRLKELYGLDFKVSEPSCVDLYNNNIRNDGISVTILEPHHNKMRIAHPPKKNKLLVRKYSIAEHFRLMGFKDEKINFGNQSYQQLCKMAANGWDVNITAILFKNIFRQINDDNV
jgi:DNA (cytosine-5)-methyltransferase 1